MSPCCADPLREARQLKRALDSTQATPAACKTDTGEEEQTIKKKMLEIIEDCV